MAESCVFSKQSLDPILCDPFRLNTLVGHPFSRSYGVILPSSFARVLPSACGYSPRPPVSVSGTDVRTPPPQAFLACRLQTARLEVALAPRTRLSGCPYSLGRPSTWPPALRSTVPCGFNETRTGPESSPASHRLRLWGLALGPASPCADCHGAGTLGLTVCGVFTRICAYSFRHPHFPSLQPNASARPSLLRERSPTPHSYE